MNRILFGVLGGLLLVAAGLFWWQGRGYNSVGAAPPRLGAASGTPLDALPSGDPNGLHGAAPPEASEVTREQKRFDRLDRDRDGRITRNEMLSPRAAAFRKLDTNHDNLLTFEEWSVRTTDRFAGADVNRDGWLSRAEYATTKPVHKGKPACRCAPVAKRRGGKTPIPAPDDSSGGDDDAGEPTT
jgi:hypothetical protein